LIPATFTNTTTLDASLTVAVPGKFLLKDPPSAASVQPDLRLMIARTTAPAAEAEEHPTRDIASLRPLPSASGIPDLPDGKPVTDTRFDIWLSYKFQF